MASERKSKLVGAISTAKILEYKKIDSRLDVELAAALNKKEDY